MEYIRQSKDANLGSMLDTTLLMDTQTYEPMETFHSTFIRSSD